LFVVASFDRFVWLPAGWVRVSVDGPFMPSPGGKEALVCEISRGVPLSLLIQSARQGSLVDQSLLSFLLPMVSKFFGKAQAQGWALLFMSASCLFFLFGFLARFVFARDGREKDLKQPGGLNMEHPVVGLRRLRDTSRSGSSSPHSVTLFPGQRKSAPTSPFSFPLKPLAPRLV